jgi:hypothetical protein
MCHIYKKDLEDSILNAHINQKMLFSCTYRPYFCSQDSVLLYQVAADEVCGCPIVSDVFEEKGEICLTAKRKCNKHYGWEKCRRAQIDMERVRQVSTIVDLRRQYSDSLKFAPLLNAIVINIIV